MLISHIHLTGNVLTFLTHIEHYKKIPTNIMSEEKVQVKSD